MIIGYTIATVAIAIPIENVVLFKYGFNRNATPHVLRLIATAGTAIGLTALTYYICSFIPDGIGWFILEFCFVVIFATIVYLLLTCRTPEFKYYMDLTKNYYERHLGKIDRSHQWIIVNVLLMKNSWI